jgi:hypothetical protein
MIKLSSREFSPMLTHFQDVEQRGRNEDGSTPVHPTRSNLHLRVFIAPSPAFEDEFETLATKLRASAIAIASLSAGVTIENRILSAIEGARRNRLLTLLREQTRREDEIKSLHRPFQVIPKSLHPDE